MTELEKLAGIPNPLKDSVNTPHDYHVHMNFLFHFLFFFFSFAMTRTEMKKKRNIWNENKKTNRNKI